MVVGNGQGGHATIRVAGDRDPRRIDLSFEHATRPDGQCEQPRNDEAHVPGLVDEIGLVRAAGRVRVLEWEGGRGDDVSGLRP